jgi:hypothetical protein
MAPRPDSAVYSSAAFVCGAQELVFEEQKAGDEKV